MFSAVVGLGRPDALPQHVGTILQRRERHCVRAQGAEAFGGAAVRTPPTPDWPPPTPVCAPPSFVVDAADHGTIDLARNELHNLLKPQEGKDNALAGIPLLVLGNKKDLPGALSERELIERMDLQMLAQVRRGCTPGRAQCESLDCMLTFITRRRARCAPTASPARTW